MKYSVWADFHTANSSNSDDEGPSSFVSRCKLKAHRMLIKCKLAWYNPSVVVAPLLVFACLCAPGVWTISYVASILHSKTTDTSNVLLDHVTSRFQYSVCAYFDVLSRHNYSMSAIKGMNDMDPGLVGAIVDFVDYGQCDGTSAAASMAVSVAKDTLTIMECHVQAMRMFLLVVKWTALMTFIDVDSVCNRGYSFALSLGTEHAETTTGTAAWTPSLEPSASTTPETRTRSPCLTDGATSGARLRSWAWSP